MCSENQTRSCLAFDKKGIFLVQVSVIRLLVGCHQCHSTFVLLCANTDSPRSFAIGGDEQCQHSQRATSGPVRVLRGGSRRAAHYHAAFCAADIPLLPLALLNPARLLSTCPTIFCFYPNSTCYRAIFRLRTALATPPKRIIESIRPVLMIRMRILPLEFAIPEETMVKRGE